MAQRKAVSSFSPYLPPKVSRRFPFLANYDQSLLAKCRALGRMKTRTFWARHDGDNYVPARYPDDRSGKRRIICRAIKFVSEDRVDPDWWAGKNGKELAKPTELLDFALMFQQDRRIDKWLPLVAAGQSYSSRERRLGHWEPEDLRTYLLIVRDYRSRIVIGRVQLGFCERFLPTFSFLVLD